MNVFLSPFFFFLSVFIISFLFCFIPTCSTSNLDFNRKARIYGIVLPATSASANSVIPFCRSWPALCARCNMKSGIRPLFGENFYDRRIPSLCNLMRTTNIELPVINIGDACAPRCNATFYAAFITSPRRDSPRDEWANLIYRTDVMYLGESEIGSVYYVGELRDRLCCCTPHSFYLLYSINYDSALTET